MPKTRVELLLLHSKVSIKLKADATVLYIRARERKIAPQ